MNVRTTLFLFFITQINLSVEVATLNFHFANSNSPELVVSHGRAIKRRQTMEVLSTKVTVVSLLFVIKQCTAVLCS
jgi:hypothetical protein